MGNRWGADVGAAGAASSGAGGRRSAAGASGLRIFGADARGARPAHAIVNQLEGDDVAHFDVVVLGAVEISRVKKHPRAVAGANDAPQTTVRELRHAPFHLTTVLLGNRRSPRSHHKVVIIT